MFFQPINPLFSIRSHRVTAKMRPLRTIRSRAAVKKLLAVLPRLPDPREEPPEDHLDAYRSIIIRVFERELESRLGKRGRMLLEEHHFPQHLQNAQNCWRCKAKRGYVYCTTCSRRECKTITLCLGCYEAHHGEGKSEGRNKQQEMQSTLQSWEQLDRQVQFMICQEPGCPSASKCEETG